MKKILFSLVVALFINLTIQAQSWNVDANHSSILFNAKHSGISFVNGRFQEFEATVDGGTPEDFSGAKVSFTAQVQSIDTGVEGRDNHLRSADFFDVENHPTLTFTSSSFAKANEEGMYMVYGDLTMRGNTRSVALMAHHMGSTKTRDGRDKVGFRITGNINRHEFGVSAAGGSVAPIIEIICNVEMAVAKEE
jgi:polyisoprenoid-binding protein YceI